MTARKDNRLLVEFQESSLGCNHAGFRAWEAVLTHRDVLICAGPYSRRRDAKRGMERFLRRIGADPSAVRWEGEV
jgi:hypothetical protein